MFPKRQILFVFFVFALLLIPSCSLMDPISPLKSGSELNYITKNDIENALSFSENRLDNEDWRVTLNSSESQVNVFWYDADEKAIVSENYLIFSSTGEKDDFTDETYSEEGLKTKIFDAYENVEVLAQCEDNDGQLKLYELSGSFEGNDYLFRSWVKQESENRLLDVRLVFPANSRDLLQEYSKDFFPSLSSCD